MADSVAWLKDETRIREYRTYNPVNSHRNATSMSCEAFIDRTTLAATLHYGAPINVPMPTPALPFSVSVLESARERREGSQPDMRELLAEGDQLWRAACRRSAEQATGPLLLPLSAGLDSRAVIAGLRACDAEVHTVTYGVPGAFDYEIAPRIANCVGATHDRLDLRSVALTREALLEIGRCAERPSLLIDMFYNAQIAARYGSDWTYVNGFVGDALSGNNLKTAQGMEWAEATTAFAEWHRLSKTDRLTEADMDPVAALPQTPFVEPALLPSIQQLDYGIRQQRLVRPIVCPPGVEMLTPFLDPDWCAFMLGLPDRLREDRNFFIKLFCHSFPELFALPSTASGGLPLGASEHAIRRHKRRLKKRRRVRLRLRRLLPSIDVPPADRRWQYLDFRTLARTDGELSRLLADSMVRLDERGVVPWLNARDLLAAHQRHDADHYKALNVLLNLELLLTARPELFEPKADQ